MSEVNVADQLLGVYWLDRWVRNMKWWWSMLFWYMGLLLTSSYKLYLQMCNEESVKPWYKDQYQF